VPSSQRCDTKDTGLERAWNDPIGRLANSTIVDFCSYFIVVGDLQVS